jgi:phospholipid N-methyltransferase
MHQQWADYRVFWRQFRDTYHSTGAVLPSGRALASALARFVREAGEMPTGEAAAADGALPLNRSSSVPQNGRRILEVGPGTGAVTELIVRGMRPEDQLVLVERNKQFVDRLAQRIAESREFQYPPGRVTLLHVAVEEVTEDVPFDLIVSGLPFNNFSVDSVAQIFAKLRRLLAPGGTLSFFEYVAVRRAKSLVSRAADRARLRAITRIFRDQLSGNEIRRDLILANVPPAWVHHVRWPENKEQGAGSTEVRAKYS